MYLPSASREIFNGASPGAEKDGQWSICIAMMVQKTIFFIKATVISEIETP